MFLKISEKILEKPTDDENVCLWKGRGWKRQTYLDHLVLLGQQGAMCVRESLHRGEVVEDELLVVRGEMDGGHAVHPETDLLLQEAVGLAHQSLQQHSQQRMQHVISELNLTQEKWKHIAQIFQ